MRRLMTLLVVLCAVIVGFTAFRLGAASAPDPTSNLAAPSALSTPAEIPPSAAHSDRDWHPAADVFVEAFLDRTESDDARLRSASTPRLATLLKRTDETKIPAGTPIGEPTAVDETAESVTVVQRLTDGSSFAFDLAPDASSEWGWVVTTVRPGEQ